MKRLHTAQISPHHLLTLLMEKKNTKLNESSHTDNSDGRNGCNISSNGKDIPKATTHGNQLTRSMPLNLSSIINPQEPISHPQPTVSQQSERCISQHYPMSHLSGHDSTESHTSSYNGPASPTPVDTPLEEFPPPQPGALHSRNRV